MLLLDRHGMDNGQWTETTKAIRFNCTGTIVVSQKVEAGQLGK